MLKTIQGLSLESELSKVIISLEGNNIGDVTQLLDKRYHLFIPYLSMNI